MPQDKRAAMQSLSGRIIDMVRTFVDILLRKPIKNGAFRKHHTEHCVYIFNAALLNAPHGAQ